VSALTLVPRILFVAALPVSSKPGVAGICSMRLCLLLCRWLGNCIGFGTRKPFLLSLWYGVNLGFSLMAAISWDVVLTFT
jgi:hypothetical protein